MKKQLLAGTALVAAIAFAAGGAAAADKMKKMMKPSISVNGYFESVVGGILDDNLDAKFTYVGVPANETDPTPVFASDAAPVPEDQDLVEDTSALDTKTDAEIHFNGRAELDSGLKIHARVELEGQNHHNTDPVDEYFLSLTGAFGNIVLGGTAGAPTRMLTSISGSFATGVGESLNFDLNDWAGTVSDAHCLGAAACAGQVFYTLRHSRLDTGDAEKVTYISPSLGGFQVGLTYSPNRANNDDNTRVDAEEGAHDGLEGAVAYKAKFGEVGIGLGAGLTAYQGANNGKDNDLSDWLVAASLDFGGGFRVAGAYKQVTDDNEANKGSMIDAGLRYVTGANQFSVTGSYGELENGEANHTSLMGSYARSLGPGVKVHVNLAWTDSQSNVVDTAGNDDIEGTGYFNTDGTGKADGTGEHMLQRVQGEQSAVVIITGIKVTF